LEGIHAPKLPIDPVKLMAVCAGGGSTTGYRQHGAHRWITWQVRFIEMMPPRALTDLQRQQLYCHRDAKHIEDELGSSPCNNGKWTAMPHFQAAERQRELGFISSVTAPFCSGCTRVRLTSDGKLRLCLLRDKEVDLLTPLRAGATLEELRQLVLTGVWDKPWGHGLADGEFATNRVMSEIGG